MTGLHYLEKWKLADPDIVGAAEYRVIYELLVDALGYEESEDDALLLADSILGVLQEYAMDILLALPSPDGAQRLPTSETI